MNPNSEFEHIVGYSLEGLPDEVASAIENAQQLLDSQQCIKHDFEMLCVAGLIAGEGGAYYIATEDYQVLQGVG